MKINLKRFFFIPLTFIYRCCSGIFPPAQRPAYCRVAPRKPVANGEEGMTLLETLIAIFIIVVGLIGSLSLVIYSTTAMRQMKEKTTAYYLAEEGIELVRASRDSYWLAGDNLFSGSNPMKNNRNNSANDYYVVDYTGYLGCRGGGCSPSANKQLYLDANGFYTHAAGTATQYSRAIRKYTSGNAVVIVSEVGWKNKIVKVEAHLYNWRDF
ncbi:MAG: hypothetical protein PHW01_01580 [Patescibacteria group bacterium]|nr:hypothetical protein [Patescibacteria group bacterium]